MKKVLLLPLSIVLCLSCGGTYNYAFPPPDEDSSLDAVFPLEIDGNSRSLEQIDEGKDFIAFQARYGDPVMMEIKVLQGTDIVSADFYFEHEVLPMIDRMPSHSRAKVNGMWKATGKDRSGWRWLAWTNQNWVMMLSAYDEEQQTLLVDAYPFISQ